MTLPDLPPPVGYVSIIPPTGTGGIVVIDVAARAVVPPTLVPGPVEIAAVSPHRNLVLVSTDGGSDTVHAIRPGTPALGIPTTLLKTITIGTNPRGIGFLPDSTRAYVAVKDDDILGEIKTATLSGGSSIFVPGITAGVAVMPGGKYAYVTREVLVRGVLEGWVDLIELGVGTIKSISVGRQPRWVEITPDGRSVFINHLNRPIITVIDTASNTAKTIDLGTAWAHAIALTPDGTRLYAATFDDSVTMIDVATQKVTDRFAVTTVPGSTVAGVAVTPNNRYVCATLYDEGLVAVIDTATNTVVSPSIDVGKHCQYITFGRAISSYMSYSFYVAHPIDDTFSIEPEPATARAASTHATGGRMPYCLAASPDGRRLYATNSAANTVAVIDLFTNTVIRSVTTGSTPMGVAVTPDSATVVVANSGSNNITTINAKTFATGTIAVGKKPVRVASSPDGLRLYVTNADDGSLSIIESGAVTRTLTGFNRPLGVAVSPDSKRVWVCNFGGTSVSVIDAASFSITSIATGRQPSGVAVSPDGKWIYVAVIREHKFVVIEASTNTIVTSIAMKFGPHSVAVSPDGKEIRVSNAGFDEANMSVASIRFTAPSTWTLTGTEPLASSPGEVCAGRFWAVGPHD